MVKGKLHIVIKELKCFTAAETYIYKNITVIRKSSFVTSRVSLRFTVLKPLVHISWCLKLSQFHNVWSWSVTLTRVRYGKGSPASSAAEVLGGAAARDILCGCWWWGAPGAAKLGRPPICAGGASVLDGFHWSWLCAGRAQALFCGEFHQTPRPVVCGLSQCSAAQGWEHLGRTAGEASQVIWCPTRRRPCCTLSAHCWVRRGFSWTGSAGTGGDCCPAPGMYLQTLWVEPPELQLLRLNPSTSLWSDRCVF